MIVLTSKPRILHVIKVLPPTYFRVTINVSRTFSGNTPCALMLGLRSVKCVATNRNRVSFGYQSRPINGSKKQAGRKAELREIRKGLKYNY